MDFNVLRGKTLVKITALDDELHFETDVGERYVLDHSQECCEAVYIDDICGDLDHLLNSPILLAEEVTRDDTEGGDECTMWTFYKLSTINGSVTIRWYGSSNGYYSVSVDFSILRRLTRSEEEA